MVKVARTVSPEVEAVVHGAWAEAWEHSREWEEAPRLAAEGWEPVWSHEVPRPWLCVARDDVGARAVALMCAAAQDGAYYYWNTNTDEVNLGLGRIVGLYYRSSSSFHIHLHIRYLFF